jgi:spore coat polysaccharide biosynthesis predicted glycosyltransferase SpsG
MRCIAIAEEAISLGIECTFIGCIESVDWLAQRVHGLGFVDIVGPDQYYPQKTTDILVIDSYELQKNDPILSRSNWKKIVAIVDEKTPIYDADLYVHPGLNSDWYQGDPRKLLTGSQYIPFRKSIHKIVSGSQGKLNKLIIFGGGTDIHNFSLEIAKILKNMKNFEKAIFFSNQKSIIEDMNPRFEVLDFSEQLDKEIELSDLVLTTASTSSLEIIVRGLPLGIACAVDNQINNYQTLGNKGIAAQIGERVSTGLWIFDTSTLANLINNANYRNDYVENSRDLFDLQGSRRIVEAIRNLLDFDDHARLRGL